MKNLISILLVLSITISAVAQTYNVPESVEYDPTGNRYFISNSNNGQILARDASGNLSVFANGISPDPYGLEMAWGNLYACCGGKIYGYNMTGTQIFNLNLGATFLNGITHDNNGNLYATDFSAKKSIGLILQIVHTMYLFLPHYYQQAQTELSGTKDKTD